MQIPGNPRPWWMRGSVLPAPQDPGLVNPHGVPNADMPQRSYQPHERRLYSPSFGDATIYDEHGGQFNGDYYNHLPGSPFVQIPPRAAQSGGVPQPSDTMTDVERDLLTKPQPRRVRPSAEIPFQPSAEPLFGPLQVE